MFGRLHIARMGEEIFIVDNINFYASSESPSFGDTFYVYNPP
jgi:hypothetical protein